jgi:predicted enzyme related to lactoylglutathione lyase
MIITGFVNNKLLNHLLVILLSMFRRIDAIILLVTDMNRSIDFYKDVLGLPLKSQFPDWAEFFIKGTKLALHPINKKLKEKMHSKTGILIGFTVMDMDETSKTLEKKGVKFVKKPKEEGFGKHAIIEDPDGYMISLVQLTGKPTEEFDLLLGME